MAILMGTMQFQWMLEYPVFRQTHIGKWELELFKNGADL